MGSCPDTDIDPFSFLYFKAMRSDAISRCAAGALYLKIDVLVPSLLGLSKLFCIVYLPQVCHAG